ncbi:cell division protein [Aliidongia dinghuensis]|uniref:Cell division protein n=1 Tax=Aliidongia dinghuensis TaxID=1867774 RepID=A0A8J2YSC8_9PROT|nr:cell division protein [Aliidongia dinghuensis]
MEIRRHLRRQAHAIVGPLIGLTLACYFAYHLVEGDRGLIAWVRLTQQIRAAKVEQARVHEERLEAAHRVSLLRPEHLDPDLLDEQARAALNLIGPGEVVILNNDGQPK